jgi:L-alanine-DL-glutamate epimerase-like enolase superfamily enzyme
MEKKKNNMKLRHYAYSLQLKNTFTISHSSRNSTAAVMVELEHDGIIGFGEASLPPYLNETVESVKAFLSTIALQRYSDLLNVEYILCDIDKLSSGNTAAKAAFDIALHDWVGKKMGYPWYKIWGLSIDTIPDTSYTIGIDTLDKVCQKTIDASRYKSLKVKLGHENDKEIIKVIRDVSAVPIRVDVNQGWTDKYYAIDMIGWLAEQNVEFIEQPLPVEQLDDTAWIRERSPMPIIADESVQRSNDILHISGAFDGINIKLMKCSGLREAYRMILLAKATGLKVMLGCMTESSCAISAAAQVSPMVDWVDLDGALLVANDPFMGATFFNGKILPADESGIGCKKASVG